MLKKIYRRFRAGIENLPARLEHRKTVITEWIAIFRKNHLYKKIKWTQAQRLEFNNFWKKNLGKTISPRWHKLYQSMNGIYNCQYLPEMLYSTRIEPKLNPYWHTSVLENKSLIELLLAQKRFCVPETVLVAANGFFYNHERLAIPRSEAEKILAAAQDIVIKPTVGGSSGHGVQILKKAENSLDAILKATDGNFIIQKKIIPSKYLSDLYAGSINTIRIITFIVDGKVHHAPICLRLGVGGAKVDNIHNGGLVIHVSDEGRLGEDAYQLGYGDRANIFKSHPDSGVVFKDYFLPFIPQVIDCAHSAHGLFPGVGMISWDITVNQCEEIIFIEANLSGQSVWFPQIVSGKSFFGEYSEAMLQWIAKN